jgi:hypothetical protein
LANLLKTFRNPILVKIFLWVTLLGKAQMAAIVMLAVTIIFWIRNKKD